MPLRRDACRKAGPEGPEGPEGSLPNMLGRRPDGAALGGHGPARPAHACTCIRRLLPHRDHGDDPCEAHCPAKVTSARALAFPVPNRFQPAFSLNHPVNKYARRWFSAPFTAHCHRLLTNEGVIRCRYHPLGLSGSADRPGRPGWAKLERLS